VALVSVRPVHLVVLVVLAHCGCKSRTTEVVVFHASSLSAVLGEATEAFHKANPRFASGSNPRVAGGHAQGLRIGHAAPTSSLSRTRRSSTR